MKCTFIVSAYQQADALVSLLFALKIQTEPDFNVIVCDNGPKEQTIERFSSLIRFDHRFVCMWTGGAGCVDSYESANLAVREYAEGLGEYLCFPSSDCYYVPQFLEAMLKPKADLMYCDMVYDPRGGDRYRVIDVRPEVNLIDKGGFLVRRDLFTGFPVHENGGRQFADGMFVESLIRRGVRHAKVPGVLWVHN
jgi:glycosyltransferase involved in cell wall biosynthesis